MGPGPATIRLRLKMDDRVRPIWTVTGKIRGSEEPESLVIAGNHRDAWMYGGVDPSSGSAALMELARTLGSLAKAGVRPRRTILLASWDAEEFTLTSSTEWGEQHERELQEHAVAYLNVDSAASGPNFGAAAVPALNRLIGEVAAEVRDPVARIPIVSAWRARAQKERGTLPTGGGGELVNNKLGSGSDYTVFLNFLGIPIADLSFDGPYGVYHSVYDNHHWVARIGDPGFRYHAAMVRVWGLLALRLANADVLPLDYAAYAGRVRAFIGDVDRRYATELAPARAAADRLVAAASAAGREYGRRADSTARPERSTAACGGRARVPRSGWHPGPALVPPPDLRAEVHVRSGAPARRCRGCAGRQRAGSRAAGEAPGRRARPRRGDPGRPLISGPACHPSSASPESAAPPCPVHVTGTRRFSITCSGFTS